MANIGPAYSFFFSYGFLVVTAGIAAPLTIVAAIVAIALLGNTLAQFSRAHPSTGGFITFVGKTFGGTSAVTTALLAGAGYIIAISSVLVISGGFLSLILTYYFGWNVPWFIFSIILTAGAMMMMVRGVGVSTKLAGFFFGFELLILIIVAIATLATNGGHISAAPFDPHHITNGFSGLAAGFPLAIYLFIGWENSAALAEETGDPRRNVPRAVYLSIAMMGVTYLLLGFSTVVGFHDNGTALSSSAIPFISIAHGVAAILAFLAYLAGMTSTLGVLISAVNSQCRLLFNAGREGLLPRWIGRVHPTRRTPVNAIFAFVGIAVVIIVGWALGHLIRRRTQFTQRVQLLQRVRDDGHDPGAVRLLPGQPGTAVLLPQVPAVRVQRGQARGAADPRHGRDHRPVLLPVQAGPGRPVQLVPVPGTGYRSGIGHLLDHAHPT